MTTTDQTKTPRAGTTHGHGESAMDRKVDPIAARLSALEARVSAMEEAPEPDPGPTLPEGARIIVPGESIAAAAAEYEVVVLSAGTYRESFGSAFRSLDLRLMAYPGEAVTIDGTGLDPHFLYLGGGHVTIEGITFTGFSPRNSGIFACSGGRLDAVGVLVDGEPGLTDNTSHGFYFLGSGVGTLTDTFVLAVPGAAVQTYTGTPSVEIVRGQYGSRYYPLLVWDGTVKATGAALAGPKATGDVRRNTGATWLDTGCTGTGPGGSVRVV